MEARWRVGLLGGLRVIHSDQVISHFRTRKTGLLLAYLVYYRQRTHPREALIELLWPESPPAAGRQSLRKALSSLRLQFERPGDAAGPFLGSDTGSVHLNPQMVTSDVEEFRAALRAASRAPAGTERARWLAQAMDLYQGELLPGCHDDWILQERQWLAESFFETLEPLLAFLEQEGEYDRALEYARHAVTMDPLREETHRDLMRLYAAVGKPAATQRQYRAFERLLKEQTGESPDAATSALADQIERLARIRRSGVQALKRSGSVKAKHEHEHEHEHEPERLNARTPERLPSDGENRLVTVLFADMSGSLQQTALMTPEEAAALINGLLTAMVDVLLRYEARVDRFLGDGVLALFGSPHAHEDDAERAIRAAMDIRSAARRLGLEVTAGVNTGTVYVGAVGSEGHQETTVVGPVVSLASRLQGQAEPGQILVGEGTYRQARQAFGFTPLTLPIKGLTQPVIAYRVERALTRSEKARGIEGLRAELIGRDKELANLRETLNRVQHGQG